MLVVLGASCQSEPAAKEFDAKDVVAAGNIAIEHGQKMQQLGASMIEHGRSINDEGWINDGQHWVIDGKTVVDMGSGAVKLGQSMRGNPVKAREVDIDQVKVQGEGLIAQGQALVEHGKVMVELTGVLQRHAQTNGDKRLDQDVVDSGEQAKQMSSVGDQLVRSGQQLVGFADGMAKSIGR